MAITATHRMDDDRKGLGARVTPNDLLQFTVIQAGRQIAFWQFCQDRVVIGRGPTAHLQIVSTGISREHAVIERQQDNTLCLRDNGSRNGTLVNGVRVRSVAIKPGDVIKIESFELHWTAVHIGGAKTAETRATDGFEDADTGNPSPVAGPAESSPPVEVREEDPDDNDADDDVAPGFSLLDALRTSPARVSNEATPLLEVLAYHDGAIVETKRVARWHAYRIPREKRPLARHSRTGVVTIQLPPGARAVVYEPGVNDTGRDISSEPSHVLRTSEVVDITLAEDGFLLRLVDAPAPENRVDPAVLRAQARYFGRLAGLSLIGHLIILLLLAPLSMWLLGSLVDINALPPEDLERFAEIQLDAPQPKAPEAKPTPAPVKTAMKETAPKGSRDRARGSTGAEARSGEARAGIPGALGNLSIGIKSNSTMLAMATNLRATTIRGGGGYAVSAIGVKGSANVVNGRPGGAFGSDMMGLGSLHGQVMGAAGGGGGLQKKGSGTVRGRVAQAPTRSVQVMGELDRSLIAKVVNAHVHEIRACYERNLLKNPSLSGKVVMEWTIEPTGSVSGVKTKLSQLNDGTVVGCIASSIRGWQFPKPKHGYVIVKYPFIFESIGF